MRLVALSNPKYTRAEAILAKIWVGHQQLSAKNTAGLEVPQIAILESTSLDGYVAKDPKTHLLPNAFFLSQRILERPDAEVAAIMAHELSSGSRSPIWSDRAKSKNSTGFPH